MKIIGNKKALHTPEFHKKKQRETRIRITIASVVFILIIIIPILILRNNRLLISNIDIRGNVVTKTEELRAIVDADLSGKYFWLIPKSNAFLYPRQRIINELLDKEPRLSRAEIKLTNTNSLELTVAERTPSALYCKDTTNISTPTDCYFMDSTGYIFSEAPSFSGGVYFVYASEPLLDSPLRAQYIEPKIFNTLDNFVKGLNDIGLYPKVFVLKHDEYHLILSNNAVIKWDISQDLQQVHSNLEALMESESFKKDNSFNNILYLEIRGNKITYKYR